jgi:hypothetical protein
MFLWLIISFKDHAAAKVGSHELKGSILYFNALTREEHRLIGIPLVVLVDYMGFRLVAESLLPIDRNTLIYGTSDAGKTMFNKDPDFNKVRKETVSSFPTLMFSLSKSILSRKVFSKFSKFSKFLFVMVVVFDFFLQAKSGFTYFSLSNTLIRSWKALGKD